ncbi:apolipoprotein Ea isoform X2 [Corythoichthys intestinalis]|nr:apolipoprotein Ea isoform X2 [Corythoichthys intestinalis]XP_061808910.1 apolipoprotein Eb-like [Nerophis lumbriciformis]
MKVFLVIVALAAISNCQAKSFYYDDPSTAWEEFFEEYMSALNLKADEIVKNIKTSQIGRELDTLIQDSVAELTAYRSDLETKLAPYTRETIGRLSGDLQGVAELLRERVNNAREQMDNYGQELRTMVEQNTDDVRLRVSTYVRKMKKRLNKEAADIQNQVTTYLEKIQTRTSNNIEDFRQLVDPYYTQVRDSTQAKISSLNDLLKSQVANMKDAIGSTADAVTKRYEKTSQDIYSTVQETMEDLGSWLQPYVAMFSDYL